MLISFTVDTKNYIYNIITEMDIVSLMSTRNNIHFQNNEVVKYLTPLLYHILVC